MSPLDRLSVRFTAFVLAIVLLGVATHYLNVGIDSTGHNSTLDHRKADDKSHAR
jgi:hypothetical protein